MNPATIPTTQLHRELGATLLDDRTVRFCVWAPLAKQATVVLTDSGRRIPLKSDPNGYHLAEVDDVSAGDRYLIQLDDGPTRPDPASRYQPDGVHQASEIIDPTFAWTDQRWRGIATHDLIIYELHIGGFTSEGTYDSAIERLDELVELGANAIELMPVAQSAGRWNWGYDGVFWFAPSNNFGRPDGLRRLVDAAHGKGLAVILDVVYNHLGPEGNYLAQFGPYLSDKHSTVWGAAPNFDDPEFGEQLRRFVIASAIHWLAEYHIDGLRVDAILCMRDDSDPHVVVEMSQAISDWSRESGRRATLIAESNVYDESIVAAPADGGAGFDAQWCDDFLHGVFATVQPDQQLCHRTYHAASDLTQTLQAGFVYSGSLREQERRVVDPPRANSDNMIYSIQNHDFIGNHPLGKRFHQLTSIESQKAAATLLMLSPAIPMLFMGEEFACEAPFRFFVDFSDPDLRQSVIDGRRREYPQHDWSAGVLPVDPEAFERSKIGPSHAGDHSLRDWYQMLIRWRKRLRESGLLATTNLQVTTDTEIDLYALRYKLGDRVATIAVRLLPTERNVEPTSIQCEGELILDSRGDNAAAKTLQANHAQVFLA